MYMKLKSDKGFTGVDITVAIIIILLCMSLVSILFFNIVKSSKGIDRKSEAMYLATTLIEEFKSKNYDDIIVTGEDNLDSSWVKAVNGKDETDADIIKYTVNNSDITIIKNLKIEDGYTCKLKIYSYVPESKKTNNENANNGNNENNGNGENNENSNDSENIEYNDLVKVVSIKVEYKVGQEVKTVDLTTSIVREI